MIFSIRLALRDGFAFEPKRAEIGLSREQSSIPACYLRDEVFWMSISNKRPALQAHRVAVSSLLLDRSSEKSGPASPLHKCVRQPTSLQTLACCADGQGSLQTVVTAR